MAIWKFNCLVSNLGYVLLAAAFFLGYHSSGGAFMTDNLSLAWKQSPEAALAACLAMGVIIYSFGMTTICMTFSFLNEDNNGDVGNR